MCYRYVAEPHPHIFIDELVPPDQWIESGASWAITSSDPQYQEVLRDPVWRASHDEVRGEGFVFEVLRLFAQDMGREDCRVDPERARLIPFVETREQKEMSSLGADADPNELFRHLDVQSKALGAYREFVHLDWARRLIGGIFFFSDTEEEGLVGGELALYRDRGFRNDRWCHDPEVIALFPPKKNSGVIFLNSNRAFHGPRSRVDVWPCVPRLAAATA